MKTRSRTPSPSSFNTIRNDNEGIIDIDHNNTATTTSRHLTHTNNTSSPLSAMVFLNPLKSGAGVVPAEAEAAPETTISGDIGQQQVHHQLAEEQGTLADKGSWEEITVTLDDIVVPGQSEHPNTEVSEREDEQALEQEDQQQQQLQQRHESAYSTEYPPTTVKAPVSTSLYPKGFLRQKPSTGILSPPNQSTASSMADLSNNSSASITANMLAIKSHVFVQQEHQQPRLMPVVIAPIYQLSTPMSSTISLSTPSRSTSPVHHYHLPIAKASSPLVTQSGPPLEATHDNNPIAQRLAIPIKDEQRQGQTGSVRFSISRSGKGHSSNSSSCSWTSSLAPPSADEMDIGKDSKAISPALGPLSSSAVPTPTPPTSQRSKHNPTHHHDHSRSSVFDDLKHKTQNVLRKAGFSIAPDAGLFADRGSTKPADLKVIRLFPASAAFLSRPSDRHSHMISDPKDSGPGGDSAVAAKSTGIFGRPRSRSVRETSWPMLGVDATLAQKQTSDLSTPTSPSATVLTTSPTAIDHPSAGSSLPNSSSSLSIFKLERWTQWNNSDRGNGERGSHQRANSGPAGPSVWGVRKRRMTIGLESPVGANDRTLDQHSSRNGGDHIRTESGPLPPLPPLPTTLVMADGRIGMPSEERKKKKGHQRRVSEATTLTMTSTRSAGASPQRFQLQQLQQQQHSYPPLPGTGSLLQQTIPEKQPAPRSMMGNLFGMVSKRRSFPSVEEEDPKRRFGYGGQQYEVTGLVSQRNSMIILDDGDEDLDDMEEDSDLDEDEHVTATTATGDEGGRMTPVGRVRKERRRQVLVNDYGFICELEDCNNNIDISNINNIGSGGDGQHGDGQGHGGQGPAELPTGSMVSELAARLSEPGSFLAEHERRRNLKKQQEFNRASEVKWIQAISHLQPDQVKKLTKFKKLARGGVPPSVRGRVWQFLANVDHYREPGLFQDLLSRGHLPIHDVIARDVHRCYPDHVHFRDGMGGTGQEDLHSILKAYAHYKPSVGYCQGMGRLVGMMLMQMPIEEAFWLLVATLEDGYLNDYFTPTLRQLRIDALVFERLLKAQDPRLAHHLQTNDVSPIMYITPWFLTLFTMSLPWASVLRVWDVFYFDGVKTLFRIGLGILQICRSTLLEDCPSSAECMDFLLHVPLNRLGPEVLLDRTAFRIRLRRESLEKMSLLTAVEMDAKEARVKVAASAKAGSGSVGEKPQPQQQQQQQQEEDEEKKKSGKRSMMGSLKGEKAAATATTPFTTTTITTITTTSTPPTSATSVRTTKSHATTSSRSDNVVTFAEPPTTIHTSTTTTTITTMGFASAMSTSVMNQETPLADPDHDRTKSNNTNTINNNPNTDFTQVNDNDTHHNEEDGDDDNAAATTTEQAPTVEDAVPSGEGNKREKEEEGDEDEGEGYSPPQQPLLIATSDIINHTINKNNGNFGTASRRTSRSSVRTTSSSLSPTSPCLPPPPHSPSSSNIITPLPPIPPTTSVCPNNNNNSINGLSGLSPLGVFRTRKRAGTHV